MIKAVIFDLDGVLVSTDEYHYLAWKLMADKEKIEFSREINNRLRGVSRMASLEIILENAKRKYSEKEKQELAELKNNLYRDYLNELRPDDLLSNAVEIIKYLKSKDIKVAIGSSSRNTPKILNQLKITNLFDAISDGNNITKSKPDPEVFLKACESLNLTPKECLVVEDATAGIEAANACGMKSVAINDAKNSNLADYKINDLIELKKIV
ncbi:MAG: beta-phosphoglucomutase [Candidatus Izemoplasmatales bacterium]